MNFITGNGPFITRSTDASTNGNRFPV